MMGRPQYSHGMTAEMVQLRDLIEKTPDADMVREMIGFAAYRLTETVGAGHQPQDRKRIPPPAGIGLVCPLS